MSKQFSDFKFRTKKTYQLNYISLNNYTFYNNNCGKNISNKKTPLYKQPVLKQ